MIGPEGNNYTKYLVENREKTGISSISLCSALISLEVEGKDWLDLGLAHLWVAKSNIIAQKVAK